MSILMWGAGVIAGGGLTGLMVWGAHSRSDEVRRTKAIIRRVAVDGVSFLMSPMSQPVGVVGHGKFAGTLAGAMHRGRTLG